MTRTKGPGSPLPRFLLTPSRGGGSVKAGAEVLHGPLQTRLKIVSLISELSYSPLDPDDVVVREGGTHPAQRPGGHLWGAVGPLEDAPWLHCLVSVPAPRGPACGTESLSFSGTLGSALPLSLWTGMVSCLPGGRDSEGGSFIWKI